MVGAITLTLVGAILLTLVGAILLTLVGAILLTLVGAMELTLVGAITLTLVGAMELTLVGASALTGSRCGWSRPCRTGPTCAACRHGPPEIDRSASSPRVRSARSVAHGSLLAVHAAMAGARAGNYSRRPRQSTSEERFPAAEPGGEVAGMAATSPVQHLRRRGSGAIELMLVGATELTLVGATELTRVGAIELTLIGAISLTRSVRSC